VLAQRSVWQVVETSAAMSFCRQGVKSDRSLVAANWEHVGYPSSATEEHTVQLKSRVLPQHSVTSE
jgi:hypothetical protein